MSLFLDLLCENIYSKIGLIECDAQIGEATLQQKNTIL